MSGLTLLDPQHRTAVPVAVGLGVVGFCAYAGAVVVAQRVGASEIRATVEAFRDLLVSHREMINGLNVYPVPDGDTGTNMSLTLESVCEELNGAVDIDSVCQAISHGSLMGARGNSGVIMSQILRGLADTLKGGGDEDGELWARAFSVAAEAAYGAVQRPVEGTILTVIREIGEAASAASGNPDADLVAVLEAARVQGHDALARTPEMLPVLKDAGVVDAGGQGLLLLLDALLHVVDGQPLPEPPDEFVVVSMGGPATSAPAANDGEKSIADLRYEVMFFLDCTDDRIDDFRSAWAEIGDSIVVVGGDGLWNCHIHTDEIGESIEAAIAVGRPHGIRVTDLLEELEHTETLVDPTAPDGGGGIVVHSNEKTRCGVITVGVGEGVRAIFESLGSTAMVLGGQTMNPPTELLLHAVNHVAADEVLLLPNNKNIIAVAEQVDGLTDKTVRVVPTRSITEGFAALLEFDPQASAEGNLESMAGAIEHVVTGEVTVAVRSAASDAGPVEIGDYIGIGPGGIQSVAADVVNATTSLLDAMLDDDHEIITLICGEGASEAETAVIENWIEETHPEVDVEIHQGDQPLYPYYIGIE